MAEGRNAGRGRRPRPRSGPGRDGLRTQRAFVRRQRARRWLTWRYLLAGFLALALAGFSIYAVWFSAWLRTEGVQVLGSNLVKTETIRTTADVPLDGPLIQVDLTAIERRVGSLAAVKKVDVSRQWPHEIRIEVTERTPIAVLDLGNRQVALDPGGTTFPAPARARKGLPQLRLGAGADKDALKEGARVVSALDAQVAGLVRFIEVQTIDEISLQLTDGRRVRWGSSEQSDDKAAVLLTLLKVKATTYDVSVPGAPTTR